MNTGFAIFQLIFALAALGINIAFIYIVIHFAIKFW